MKRYVCAIFILIFTYLLFFSIFKIDNGDEGCIITASMRILNGELPYKDFFLHTPPITYYAIAAAFKIFGSYLIVARVLTAIIGILIALLLYLISRRIMPSAYALIAPLIFMVWGTSQVPNPDYAWFGLLFSLISIYAFAYFLEHENPWCIITAGIFSGISFLSKQNLGLCVFAVLILSLVTDKIFRNHLKMAAPNKAFIKNLLLLTVFFIIPILVTIYFFHLKGAAPYFLKYVFLVGGESGISRMQILPYPRIQFPQIIMAASYCIFFYFALRRLDKKNTIFPFNVLMLIFLSLVIFAVIFERTLPHFNRFLDYVKTGAIRGFLNFLVLSCVTSIVLSVIAIRKKRQETYGKEMAIIFISIFALLYIWAGLFISRDMLHHIYSIPPTFILAGYIFYRIRLFVSSRNIKPYRVYLNYAIVFPVVFILMLGFVINVNNEVFRDSPSEKPFYMMRSFVNLERARYILTDAAYAKDVEDLVNFIDAETTEREKIFYPYFTDDEIYFLANRMPASFHHWIHHYTVKAPDQDVIINDIIKNNARVIFLPKDRFDSRASLANSSKLERYIYDHYAFKRSFGRFVVLERN